MLLILLHLEMGLKRGHSDRYKSEEIIRLFFSSSTN